ncbi:MAG: hypothetical protein V5A31_03075 [Haloferacaceae archaeon]|jgi:hypothetical protein
MRANHTVDLELRTDDAGDLFARGTVGGHEVLVATAGDGLVGAGVDAVVPVGDEGGATGPTTVGKGTERRFGGVELRHAHRRVEIADAAGRRVTLDASAEAPAVGVEVRRADGEYDQYVGRIDDTPRRLRVGADGVGYGRPESVVDRGGGRDDWERRREGGRR